MRRIKENESLEAQLKTTREHLDFIIKAGDIGLWYYELKTGNFNISEVVKEYFGIGKKADAVFEDLARSIPEEYLIRIRQSYQDALNDSRSHEVDFPVLLPDRPVRWLKARGTVLYDDNFEPAEFNGVILDITGIIATRNEIELKEQSFRALAEHSPDIIHKLDKNYNHIYVNPAIEILTGKSMPDLAGKPLAEMGLDDEDLNFFIKNLDKVKEIRDTVSANFEADLGEEKKMFHTKFIPELNQDGEVQNILVITRDVTDLYNLILMLNQEEKLFMTSIESLLHPFLILIPVFENNKPVDFLIKYVNNAGVMFLGISRRKAANKRLLTLFPEYRDSGIFSKLAEVYTSRHPWKEIVEFKETAAKFRGTLEVSAARIEEGIIVSWFDLTKLKETEKELSRSLDEKEYLIKEMHHRIKNNLQIVSSLINISMNGVKDEEAKRALQDNISRVRSIAIAHEYLYRSSGLYLVDMQSYLKTLVDFVKGSLGSSQNIDCSCEADSADIDSDLAVSLGLITSELMTNAYKYAFNGRESGIIKISAVLNDDRIELLVKDNGNGMPEGYNVVDSEGLGFQIINALIQKHNGSISFIVNEGTEFSIILLKNQDSASG